jgi:uncharacterized protein GlcG (DUF336 family)
MGAIMATAHGRRQQRGGNMAVTPHPNAAPELAMNRTLNHFAAAALAALCLPAAAQTATHTVRLLTPEAALKATQAALADCRQRGFQVAVAVVDRSGVVQALLRDRFAGAHTPDTAVNKGWTAVSFRSSTAELARATQAGQPSSGIRQLPRVVAVGGGVVIEAAGTIVGGIGVSGAPGGDADELCARAGVRAIADDLEL